MIRLVHRLLLLITLASAGATIWALQANPLAQMMVERSQQGASRALARATAWRVTPEWVDADLRVALEAQDYDRLQLVLDLALGRGIQPDPALLHEMAAFAAREESVQATVRDCATCAYDIATCKRIAEMAACAIPVELSPLGDLNALRRAGTDAAMGRAVDKLDAGLAVTGLAATGLAVASGGSSLTIKAGASVLRAARRMGAITPAFSHSLRRAADIEIDWPALPGALVGRTPVQDSVDMAKLAVLGALAGDLGRVRAATSTADALVLARYIDSPGDARKLANLAETQGASTRATLHVLGKSRAFRALTRLSRAALVALSLIVATFGLLLALISETLRVVLRPRKGRVA